MVSIFPIAYRKITGVISLIQGKRIVEKVTDLKFRSRIKEEFDDGDECLVTLKDRAVEPTEDEADWYDMAFGSKRNYMKIRFKYYPGPSIVSER